MSRTEGACILVVDDQQDHLAAMRLILEGMGYRMLSCSSGVEALAMLEAEPVDLIVADIAMPRMNGYQLLEAVRRQPHWATIPFLFLTARALDSDIRYGKSLGVDDYLTKPIQPEDLLASIEGKLLRRQQLMQSLSPPASAAAESPQIRVGPLEIDPERHKVWHAGQPVSLSVREFALLAYLARHAGRVVETHELLHATHGISVTDLAEAGELLRPLVRSLRRKLGCQDLEPGCIETVRGMGYRMVETEH